MADIALSGLQPTTAATAVNSSIQFKQTTATGFIDPIFSSIIRTISNVAISKNFTIANLDSPVTGLKASAVPGLLIGRRPRFGQLFPRGYFNR